MVDESGCTCLEVFGDDPNCLIHNYEALENRIADLENLIEAQHGDVVSRTAKLLYDKDTRIAELAAENERLTKERDEAERLKINWFVTHLAHQEANHALGKANSELFKRAMDAERRIEALASTGAVKVKRKDVIHQIALWSDDEGLDLSMGQGDDLASRILSALEDHPRDTNTVDAHETANVSDKPEGPQEPVAWRPISSAPQDGTQILVYFDADSDPYYAEEDGKLTAYGAHAEGGDYLDGEGICTAVWVGGWHESTDEYGSGYWMPGWWFAWFNGDTDYVVAPTHWMPVPAPPAIGRKA